MKAGRRTLWIGDKLARLRIDYEAHAEPLKVLSHRHVVSQSKISRLARLHRWIPRFGKWEHEPTPPLLAYVERAAVHGNQA